MREIIVDWTVLGAAPGVSVTYWDAAKPVAGQRDALHDYLTACAPRLASAAQWRIRTEGRELDASTGTLVGFWNDSTSFAGTGSGVGATGADATQVIAGWLTDTVIDGRRLQGRTFLPGLIQTSITAGNLATAAQTVFQNAGDALVASDLGLSVWHRPKGGSLGLRVDVTSAKVPTMLGVQRGRRL